MIALDALGPTGEARGAGAEALTSHYGDETAFFRSFLGPEMVYSCALFDGTDDLDEAQRRKLDHHLTQARVVPGARLLDIGCGWGGALFRAVREHGAAEALGLTPVAAQARHVDDVGVAGVEVRTEVWQEHRPSHPYDAIISIGAFEHFAQPGEGRAQKVVGYRAFFESCRSWLVEGGRLSLQTIAFDAADDDRTGPLSEHMRRTFPESTLPHLSEIVEAAEPSFRVLTLRTDPSHYERTCRLWRQRLVARRTELMADFGAEQVHSFSAYFAASVALFARRDWTLHRLTLERR